MAIGFGSGLPLFSTADKITYLFSPMRPYRFRNEVAKPLGVRVVMGGVGVRDAAGLETGWERKR